MSLLSLFSNLIQEPLQKANFLNDPTFLFSASQSQSFDSGIAISGPAIPQRTTHSVPVQNLGEPINAIIPLPNQE